MSGFYSASCFGYDGSQSLLHVGALYVRLSEGFLVLMAVCSVRSSCVLYLVVSSCEYGCSVPSYLVSSGP